MYRRNADEELRQVERNWIQAPTKDNAIHYWEVALRSGEIPRPLYSSLVNTAWERIIGVWSLEKYEDRSAFSPNRRDTGLINIWVEPIGGVLLWYSRPAVILLNKEGFGEEGSDEVLEKGQDLPPEPLAKKQVIYQDSNGHSKTILVSTDDLQINKALKKSLRNVLLGKLLKKPKPTKNPSGYCQCKNDF